MMILLAGGNPSTTNPIARWILLGLIVLFFAFLLYAFFTRFREDWDAVLRKWSAERRGRRRDDEDPPTAS